MSKTKKEVEEEEELKNILKGLEYLLQNNQDIIDKDTFKICDLR